MHYGCSSCIGLKMRVSLERLVLELGVSPQPLQESYKTYNSRVTHCWLTSLWEKCDKLNVKVEFLESILQLPCLGDKWIMCEFARIGYDLPTLVRLNRVRLHQQVLFLSCVLGASGKELDEKYLIKRKEEQTWSTLGFPQEKPPRKDFLLWRQALTQLVPAGGIQDRLGVFQHGGYKIWDWQYDKPSAVLYHTTSTGVDKYIHSQQARYANRQNRGEKVAPQGAPTATVVSRGVACSVKHHAPNIVAIASTVHSTYQADTQDSLLDVLLEWGSTWLWDDLVIVGDEDWIFQAIQDGSIFAVTDGSYMKEHFPDVCSAAFVLECQQGRGRIVGSFVEKSSAACAYRGELLGLMAIHLLLLAANKVQPDIQGYVTIFSDCLGALNKVAHLPWDRIPSKSSHSDVLKNIMTNCSSITFSLHYCHVKAHQDDDIDFNLLSIPAQLNCRMDAKAKQAILDLDKDNLPRQENFPLEPVAVYAGEEKLTSSTSAHLHFWTYRETARSAFHELGVLFANQFDEVDWPAVYHSLYEVPRMFSIWACKQVMDMAPTNYNQRHYKVDHDTSCPSCGCKEETCAHILDCEEAGRVDCMNRSIDNVDTWLRESGTDSRVRQLIVAYAKGRGGMSMIELTRIDDTRFMRVAASQDTIGWRRFMEGMISKEWITLQREHYTIFGGKYTPEIWAQQLVIKLLEVTHGQWLYRNIQVHDSSTGLLATQRKKNYNSSSRINWRSEVVAWRRRTNSFWRLTWRTLRLRQAKHRSTGYSPSSQHARHAYSGTNLQQQYQTTTSDGHKTLSQHQYRKNMSCVTGCLGPSMVLITRE